MPTNDKCVTIAPYFKVQPGKLPEFKKLCERFMQQTSTEPGCLYYGFAFDGDLAFCREGYTDAQALLAHVNNVSSLIQEALKIATVARIEVHGPETELAGLRNHLTGLNPQYFVLEYGFRV